MPPVIKYTQLWDGAGLLEVDSCRLLLDCGWNEKFDVGEVEAALTRYAPQIDAVLLSHPDVPHLGALPVAVARFGLNAPIYGTQPVHNMGQMFLYDAYMSRSLREQFTGFTLNEVDAAFNEMRWQVIKYNQRIDLVGRGKGISVTARPAGHMLGGTAWLILTETDEIVFSVDFNIFSEAHLPSFSMEGLSPTLLITGATSMGIKQESRKMRESNLKDTIFKTLQRSGNVLIPVDSAGRILELALILDRAWSQNERNMRRLGYGLALLTNFSYTTTSLAQLLGEYMCDEARDTKGAGPFDFNHIHLCHDFAELERVRSPKVVLTSHSSLSGGFAAELLMQWATKADNSIILTQSAPQDSVAYQLAQGVKTVSLRMSALVPLEGNELTEYYRSEQRKRAAEKLEQAAQRRLHDDDDSSSDEEDEGHALAAGGLDGALLSRLQSAGSLDQSGLEDEKGAAASQLFRYDAHLNDLVRTGAAFVKLPNNRVMFPLGEDKRRFDMYGELINEEDFALSTAHVTSGLRRRTAGGEAAGGDMMNADDYDDDEQEEQQMPTKCIVHNVTLTLQCQVEKVGFEGLTDELSMLTLLSNLAPRKLVLVRGSSEQLTELRNICISKNVTRSAGESELDVVLPRLREAVDVSSARHILQSTMTDALVSTLHVVHKDDYELAFVSARITRSTESDTYLLDVPVQAAQHTPIFIGEVMLANVRDLLREEGMQADLDKGVLVCNSQVAVRKAGTGKLTVEGPAGPVYYRVRKLLYQQYAIV